MARININSPSFGKRVNRITGLITQGVLMPNSVTVEGDVCKEPGVHRHWSFPNFLVNLSLIRPVIEHRVDFTIYSPCTTCDKIESFCKKFRPELYSAYFTFTVLSPKNQHFLTDVRIKHTFWRAFNAPQNMKVTLLVQDEINS